MSQNLLACTGASCSRDLDDAEPFLLKSGGRKLLDEASLPPLKPRRALLPLAGIHSSSFWSFGGRSRLERSPRPETSHSKCQSPRNAFQTPFAAAATLLAVATWRPIIRRAAWGFALSCLRWCRLWIRRNCRWHRLRTARDPPRSMDVDDKCKWVVFKQTHFYADPTGPAA